MTERLQQSCGFLNRCTAVRMKRCAITRLPSHNTNFELLWPDSEFIAKWTRLRGSGIEIAGHIAGNRVEHCRSIAHTASHDAFGGKAVPNFAEIGTWRDPPARGFEANQTAFAGRDANRSTTVTALSNCHQARRDRRRRAAA